MVSCRCYRHLVVLAPRHTVGKKKKKLRARCSVHLYNFYGPGSVNRYLVQNRWSEFWRIAAHLYLAHLYLSLISTKTGNMEEICY